MEKKKISGKKEADYSDLLQLSEAIKGGDEKAFDILFRKYCKDLCRFAAIIVNDYTVAEDIVQELFVAIWQKRALLDSEKAIGNYLFVATRNQSYRYLRDKHDNVALDILMNESMPSENNREFGGRELNDLWKNIDDLPLQCKIIFKLVVLEEMKYKEVADHLDISVNTVKTQIKIAYKTLREKLKLSRFFLYYQIARLKKTI